MKDIIVLVADKNMEFLIKGLLPRVPKIERIRDFSYDILIHPHRDPGVFNDAADFLRPFLDKYHHAMVIFDHSGCGQENEGRTEIEKKIELGLSRCGWKDKACAITIEPELENWIWVGESHLKAVLSWNDKEKIRDWLEQNGWYKPGHPKPISPKEAFEECLKKCGIPRSSSLYQEVSNRASYKQCIDPAFRKMIDQLNAWFQPTIEETE